MRLADLVARLGGSVSPFPGNGPQVTDVHLDSRRVDVGDLFVALRGMREDGARYALDALARGASAVLTERPISYGALRGPRAVVEWVHPEARRVAGMAAALVHGEPSAGLFTVAVTGTNGKTTTAHLVGQLLAKAGRRPAVLGTAGNRLADGALRPAVNTTPDSPSLQRMLAQHRELGGDSLAMEASSHALDQERLAGLRVDVAVFTNLTRDHLDYHGDLESYARAKERLFRALGSRAHAVVNADDPCSRRMGDAARAAGARVHTYGARTSGDLRATTLETDLSGTRLLLSGMGISRTEVWLPLAGGYNVENALAAAAAALLSGASPSTVVDGLATASGAPGRLERVDTRGRGFSLFVDYAHTEDALEKVCRTVREGLELGSGRLGGSPGRMVVVFGCGGDRDRGKRAPMGRVVGEIADVAVVTSDNPRGEEPSRIAEEILAGMRATRAELVVELDRRAAIERAVRIARPGDVVLIAGKGHETTQTIGRRVDEFDDRRVAAEALR